MWILNRLIIIENTFQNAINKNESFQFQNGLLSALPYATMWIVGIIFGWLSDRLITKRILKVEFSRKLFNSIGLWGPMCALFVLAFIEGAGIKISIMLLTLAVGINAGTYVGFQVSLF